MKSKPTVLLAAIAILLLANFSSQDSTVTGRAKPPVNFSGTVTDLRETFKDSMNITIDGGYKGIAVYQQPPHDKDVPYEPSDNITRLDLAEIHTITISPNQKLQKFGNRDYIVITVASKDAAKSTNSYLIEADKRVFFDQVNAAGPIEKEIKLRSITEIMIDGYKQQDPEITSEKKPAKPTQSAQAQQPSRARRFVSYVKNSLKFKA